MSTAPRRPDLANEPVGRLMLRLSIPTITAQLVNMLYNLVDRIYISYIPDVGTLALTGLGVCLPIILLVSAFAALCADGCAVLLLYADSAGVRRNGGCPALRPALHCHLQPRHGVRAAVSRLEPVHHRAGLLQGGDADGADWRGAEHAA